jgi:hypothetical protein
MGKIFKSIALVISLVISGTAVAEPIRGQREMVCDTMDALKQEIGGNWKEIPIMLGYNQASNETFKGMMLTHNKSTGSWTVIIINNEDNMGCIIAVGDVLQFDIKSILDGQLTSF